MGPLLNFEEGLNPSTGSTFSARFSSISPIDFMYCITTAQNLNIFHQHFFLILFPHIHGEPNHVSIDYISRLTVFTHEQNSRLLC